MGFKVSNSERQFTARVTANVPVDGGTREERFKARFRVLNSDQLENYNLSATEGTTDFLRAVIVELFELVDDSNNPIAYNDDVRDQVILDPPARIALIRAYFDSIGKGGRKGN
jgi:hypothetical protein